MGRYIIRRLLTMPLILLGISIFTFVLIQLAPGDPITIQFGFDPRGQDPEVVARMREELGLNDPVPVQYVHYLNDLLHGDMGKSITSKTDVSFEILSRVPATLELAFSAMLLVIVIGVPLGILCALYRGSLLDNFLMTLSLLGVSMPGFWFGIMLILFFSLQMGLLPSMGRGDGPIWTRLNSLILPSVTLSMMLMGIVTRVTRSSMLEVLGMDYMRTARAKGATRTREIFRHALPNALIPVITMLAMQFAGLLGGSVIVETIFAWPGMGRLAVNSILRQDYPIVMGTVLVFAGVVVVVNLLLDIVYTLVDPRIRLG
ncbi:MAG TPA: ABC transporter permease [Bellilinea sp.]|jgi:peptide/nickel transport system permease protein|nr:ABC transporter permease [Bellilinea sp.]